MDASVAMVGLATEAAEDTGSVEAMLHQITRACTHKSNSVSAAGAMSAMPPIATKFYGTAKRRYVPIGYLLWGLWLQSVRLDNTLLRQ